MTNKNKNILLGVLIVGVLSMTVAFAALSTRLNIQGTTNVAATKWNIHFDDWQPVEIRTVTVGGQTHSNTASAPAVNQLTMQDNNNVTKVSGVNVTLNQPGDTAKYTFEIVNEGTIDGKLSNFTVTDTSQNALVDYDVKCYADSSREGTAITTNHVLTANGGLVYCYLQVSYKDQENSHTAGSNQVYHQDSISTNVSAAWTWVQNDGASSPATSSTPEPDPAPVADSWDTYYYVNEYYGDTTQTFDNDWSFWGQVNSTKRQICGKFGGTTECFDYNSNGYTDCFHYNQQTYQTSVSGYIADVKSTMEGHNYNCTIYQDNMECKKTGTSISLNITKNSTISVYTDDDGYCETNDFGDIDCAGY